MCLFCIYAALGESLLKGQFMKIAEKKGKKNNKQTENTNDPFYLYVVSSHADSVAFICFAFEIFVTEISASATV